MNKYFEEPLENLIFEELLSLLYNLGTIENMQASYELDELYDAVRLVKEELQRRFDECVSW